MWATVLNKSPPNRWYVSTPDATALFTLRKSIRQILAEAPAIKIVES
jgi:hypothetical protein